MGSSGHEIRQRFLDYFKENGHTVVRSSSLVPSNDPTLLFTNAGMNQFKDLFTGKEVRSYRRAATAQKVFRASGKHNDLENVGFTARHHTFFEMLGNFSFGDYFKREAMRLAYQFLVERMNLDPNRFYFTVFEKDDEAALLWQKEFGVRESRILRMGEKDNFWAMGETGPCGPCSEILYDQGEAFVSNRADSRPQTDGERFLEIWNLVFMQFERGANGSLTPLPKPSIDTGMGLERLTAVVQQARTNYDTDLFRPLFRRVEQVSAKQYGADPNDTTAMRVIADHARGAAFLLADGVLPGSGGRRDVVRRIIRRAVRYGKKLGIEQPFLHEVADAVIDTMGNAYPELKERAAFVVKNLLEEEKRFRETLDKGLSILDDAVANARAKQQSELPGSIAFTLHDTFGFPLDLTQVIAREHGFSVDDNTFQKLMAEQRERGRKAWKGSGEKTIDDNYRAAVARTGGTEFVGYTESRVTSEIDAISLVTPDAETTRVRDRKSVASAAAGQQVELLTRETPFYGESGGQKGDLGIVRSETGTVQITDTLKPLADLIVHRGVVTEGRISVGEPAEWIIDRKNRDQVRRHHSATHLLQWALRQVLGEHVQQYGSMVSADRLRFDFTHPAPVTDEEQQDIERLINHRIIENSPVTTDDLPFAEASRTGAMALFTEKYGDRVRVVSIGDFSKELCGGTHVARSGDIGLFKIVSESGVAAGVRRLEAVAGEAAIKTVHHLERQLADAASVLQVHPNELVERAERLQNELRQLKHQLAMAKKQSARLGIDELLAARKEIAGMAFVAGLVDAETPEVLREIGDQLRDRIKDGVVMLGRHDEGKITVLIMVTKDRAKTINAGTLMKTVNETLGSRGGGRPDMAQAGGGDRQQWSTAIERMVKNLSRAN